LDNGVAAGDEDADGIGHECKARRVSDDSSDDNNDAADCGDSSPPRDALRRQDCFGILGHERKRVVRLTPKFSYKRVK
jgi:hypothetical protein